MAENLKIPLKGTRASIFILLLDKASNVIELKEKLGINESAVRRHLDILERDGIVSYYFDRPSIGRPKKMYYVTQLGKNLLPKRSELLVSLLMRKIAGIYGKNALEQLMNEVSEDFTEYFMSRTPLIALKDTEQRLNEMVKLFDDFGFFTSLSKQGHEYVITYRNCVFQNIIPELGGWLCKMHKSAVVKIAGVDKVKLEKCITKGDNFCRQRIFLN